MRPEILPKNQRIRGAPAELAGVPKNQDVTHYVILEVFLKLLCRFYFRKRNCINHIYILRSKLRKQVKQEQSKKQDDMANWINPKAKQNKP